MNERILQPVFVRHQKCTVVGIIAEVLNVVSKFSIFSPNVSVQGFQVLGQLVGAIRKGTVPFFLTPRVSQSDQSLIFFFFVLICFLIENLDLDAKNIDDGISMTSQNTTRHSFRPLNFMFSSTKGRTTHHTVIVTGIF